VITRVLGQVLGSSPLVLAAAKAGLAIKSNKKRQIDDEFIRTVPKTPMSLRCTRLAKGCKAFAF